MKRLLIPGVIIIGLMISSCGKSYDDSMKQGAELQTDKEYTLALENYDNAILKAETGAQRIAANIEAGNLASKDLRNMTLTNAYYQATLADLVDYSDGDLLDMAKQALNAQANAASVNMYKLWIEKYSNLDHAVNIRYELAEVYHKNLRDLRNAIITYEGISDDYPGSEQAPKALFSIGYIYANELGENDPAVKYYSLFLEKYPDHEMSPSVEFELKYLGKSLEEIPELQHLLNKTS